MIDFSIIVPVYNEKEQISPCINSLLGLNYPKSSYEIIVVDDESTDSTYEVLKKFKNKVKVIRLEKNRGPSETRNIGSKNAKGKILCFTDADCRVNKNWLREITKTFKTLKVEVVAGKTNADFKPDTFLKKYLYNNKLIFSDRYFYGINEKMKIVDKEMPTCNLSIKKDIFSKIGGFKKEYLFGEDDEICARLIDSGYHIGFAPKAIVFNSYLKHTSSLKYFVKKRIKYGIGWAWVALGHPKKMRGVRLILSCLFNFLYHPILLLYYSVKEKNLSISSFPLLIVFEDFLNLLGVLIGFSKIGFKRN